MVVVAIVAILAAMAAPSYRDMIDRYRLRGAADGVISLISNARAGAVKSDLDVNIKFTGGSNWCVGANSALPPTGGAQAGNADPCTCTDSSQCLISGVRTATQPGAYPGVTIGTLPAAFIFDSKLGTTTPLGGREITLTSPSGKYDMTIKVNALGQASSCTPATKSAMPGVATCSP